ncbi:MAG: PqqD family protein [Bacteroidota bacterium]
MKLKKNVAVSEAGLLFNPVTGESFSVNPIGVEILNLLRDEKNFNQISDVILGKYSTDKQTLEKDFQDFLDILSHNNLLEGYEKAKA